MLPLQLKTKNGLINVGKHPRTIKRFRSPLQPHLDRHSLKSHVYMWLAIIQLNHYLHTPCLKLGFHEY